MTDASVHRENVRFAVTAYDRTVAMMCGYRTRGAELQKLYVDNLTLAAAAATQICGSGVANCRGARVGSFSPN